MGWNSKTSQAVPDNVVDLEKLGQPLLSFSVLLIYVYLIFYIFYEAYTEIDDKDEDFVNCTCLERDKSFYNAIFTIFTVIWGAGVIVWTIFGFIDLVVFW